MSPFVYSSVDGYLVYFHLLAIMDNAVMNTHVQVFVWSHAFNSFGYITGNEIIGPQIGYIFNCIRNCQSIPQSGISVYILTRNVWDFQCSAVMPTFDIVSLFNFIHSGACETVPHCYI